MGAANCNAANRAAGLMV